LYAFRVINDRIPPSRLALAGQVHKLGSVREAAEQLQVGEATIRQWIAGKREPTAAMRERMAQRWPNINVYGWSAAAAAVNSIPSTRDFPKALGASQDEWSVRTENLPKKKAEELVRILISGGTHAFVDGPVEPFPLAENADPRRLTLKSVGFLERVLDHRPSGPQLHVGVSSATALLAHARWMVEQVTPEKILDAVFEGDAERKRLWLVEQIEALGPPEEQSRCH
jgi:transcriptional regulator with XRE-family HTH domain